MDIILNNRYSLIERIGGGGMADVYRAKDERLDRDVAIKILKEQFAEDEDFVKGFRRESHAIARLNHPNIVSIYDVGMDVVDGVKKYYIVMELIEGKNLKDLIRSKGKLNVSEAIELVSQIANGLKNAHQNGIIHRDVKPQNILLQADKTPKVTDFGIAQGVSQATMTTNDDILGSVHYFSPEQASGRKTDEKSDIYSLGIVLYEMLTNELPFDGDTPITVALKHIQEPLPKPSTINPAIPANLDQVILKMTEKDPEDRYQNIDELLEGIKNLNQSSNNDYDTLVIPAEERERLHSSSADKKRVRRAPNSARPSRSNRPTREEKKPRGRIKSILMTLLAILAAGAVATGGFYLLVTRFFGGGGAKDIEVPDLIGINIEEAREIARDKDLELDVIETRTNPDYDPDDIIDQDPKAGTNVKSGYLIKVIINSKESLVEVDDYVGMDYDTVARMIADTDLVLGSPKYEEVEDDDQVGKILSQDLRSGTRVENGSVISFVVGEEKEVETTEVPDLIGMSSEAARKLLEDKDLSIGNIKEVESDRFAEGTVTAQSIEGGEEVEINTTVDLTVVVSPEKDLDDGDDIDLDDIYTDEIDTDNGRDDDSDEEKSAELSFNLQGGSDQEVELRIDRVQDGRRVELYRGMHPANAGKVIIDVSGKKGAVYTMYVDGEDKGTVEQW